MFHNISNPKWFGNWSRLEDDYLGNGGTDIADNFTFSKMEKTGELLLRLRIEKDDYQWIQCPNSESAVNMMNMVMDAHMPKDFFDGFVCGDEEYGLNEEAHEMASGRKEIDTQTETKDAPEVDADKEVK